MVSPVIPFLNLPLVFRTGARAEINNLIMSAHEAGDEEEAADLEALDEDPAVIAMYVPPSFIFNNVTDTCQCMPGIPNIVNVM